MTSFHRLARPFVLLLVILGIAIYIASQAHLGQVSAQPLPEQFTPESTGGPDAFGYTFRDSAEANGPVYDWIDISSTGTSLGIGSDSRHGPLSLGFNFSYYGTSASSVWMGSDGWITVGAGDPGSNDNSNDCPLPHQNGNENIIGGVWDNLDALITTPNGQAYHQSFPAGSCPFGSYPGACFVGQWQNTHFAQLPDPPFDTTTFEIVLFDNNDIVVQIQEAGTRAGLGSTTGIENAVATDGLVYSCNTASSLSDNSAVQFYYPVFAPRFDTSYKTAPAVGHPIDPITYTIVISNVGNVASVGTVMTDTIPAGTTYIPGSVSCVGGGTTICTFDSGQNEIRWEGGIAAANQTIVTYRVMPGGSCGATVANEAVITAPDAAASPLLLPATTTLADEFTLYTFEANNGGFDATNDWQYGIPSWPVGLHAHSGDRLWATVLDGYYNNLGASSVLSQTISLAGLPNNAKLLWWQYVKTNNSLFDVGRVLLNGDEVYTSSGADEPNWTAHTVSLAPYVGGNLSLAFDFFSTLSINSDGWYVDDVAVYYCVPQPVPNLDLSTKTALPIAVTGKRLDYTITLNNFATVSAPSTTLVDPIPPGTTYVNGSATNGAVYNAGQNQIEWTGTVGANGQVDVSFAVTVAAAPGTTITNTATIDQPSISQPVIVATTSEVVTSQTASYPSCSTFESGSLPAYMYQEVTSANGSTGRARVTNAFPHAGTFGFDLDTNDPSGTGNGITRQAGIIVADLLNAPAVSLSFWVRGHADENNPEDGVFISDDGGVSFAQIYDPPSGDWTPYELVNLNLTDAAAAAGMSFTETFLIKFQSLDNYAIATPPLTSDGYSYDDICLEAVVAQATITPTSLSSTQFVNQVITQTLTINSIGNDLLNWNWTEASSSCAAPGNVAWLSVMPINGSTAANNTTAVVVSLDSSTVPLGSTVTANLCLNSNDVNEPVIAVPVSLTVTSPPTILVAPNPLTATLTTTQTTDLTFTITNQGLNTLDWYSLEDPSVVGGAGALVYGLDGNSNRLMAFNSTLQAPLYPVGGVGTIDYAAADILPQDPLYLYAINNINRFVKINRGNATITEIGTSALSGGLLWSGLAAHPTSGILYASASNCTTTSRLFTIDTTTGVATAIGDITNGACISDIAINANGQIYGLNEATDQLISINPTTGAGTPIGPLGYNAISGQGLDFDDSSGTLYLSALLTGPVSQLRTVNTSTGTTTVIGSLSDGTTLAVLGDIAIVPNAGCTPGAITWASTNQTSGTLAGNSSVTITVNLSAIGLDEGVYHGAICILSNDPATPQATVLLELTVNNEDPPPPTVEKVYLPLMSQGE